MDESSGGVGILKKIFLGGDFNAVLQPSLDRITKGLRSGKSCESHELNNLVEHLDLLDAAHLTTHAEEDSVPDPLSHFSFWRDHSASRINRFYLSNNIAGVMQRVEACPPVSKSDHQEVRVWLTLQNPRRTRSNRSNYPIQTASPDWVNQQIRKRLQKLKAVFQQQSCPAQAWDTFATRISVILREVARQDSDRTSVYFNNLMASLNHQHKHRYDYRQTYNNARTRQSQNVFGRMLQPTLTNLKRFFKRHAD
ncbi:Hypothetical protein PHPALM_5024 [Phytophthora palmivora]|uniref:Endonuclease/exonuclease/phosphatase domain-containing protein n=1 Tax=Phytophthora palmivora TaxID=4796 RepID=A0A2P4YIE4_9STRA|nr:Hypothetical protein PHPALM_5024 [Phytophthora palmivora]